MLIKMQRQLQCIVYKILKVHSIADDRTHGAEEKQPKRAGKLSCRPKKVLSDEILLIVLTVILNKYNQINQVMTVLRAFPEIFKS